MTQYRITLRTLLLCVFTLCLFFAVTAQWWRAYRRQDATVNDLWRIEARPYYKSEERGVLNDAVGMRPTPWFYDFVEKCEPVLDRDMFFSVSGVSYESSRNEITDKDVGALRGLCRLQWVDVTVRRGVTDASVKDLSEMKSLRVLSLHGTSISRKGYETLRRELPNAKIYWSEPE